MHTSAFIRPLLLSLVAALATAPAATAQGRLTLDEALALGLAQNPALRSAQAAERESAERSRQARSSWLPRVDVTESWQRGNQPVFVFGSLLAQRRFTQDDFRLDALNHPSPLANFRAAVTIEQVVFDGARTTAAVRAASLGEDLARVGSRDAAASVRLGVTQAYGEVLMAQAQRKAANAAVLTAEEDVRRVERRRDAGMATQADVLALRVHQAGARTRAISATSQEAVARARLNEVLGEPLDRHFQLDALPTVTDVLPALAELEDEAVKYNPAAIRAAVQERLAHEAVSSARGGFLPQAAVQGGYEMNGGTFSDRASSWTIGAVFRWNLFSGFSDSARLGEARAALDRVRADRQRLDAQTKVALRTALARIEDARAREEVGRAARAQAAESRRIVRDRYDAGLASVNDLLRSADAVLDAEFQHTAATVDILVSAAMLDRARGR